MCSTEFDLSFSRKEPKVRGLFQVCIEADEVTRLEVFQFSQREDGGAKASLDTDG